MELRSRFLTESDIGVGLAVPKGARLRWLKRILARLMLPFLGYQVHVNRVVIDDLAALQAVAERLDALVELVQHQSFTRLHESIGPLHADINALERHIDEGGCSSNASCRRDPRPGERSTAGNQQPA